MHQKVTSTLAFLGSIVGVYGQSDFLGLPASAYLDNISDSAAIQRAAPYVPMTLMGVRADDQRFWTKKRVSISYAYAKTSFDNGVDVDTHSVVPELYLESKGGLSLNFAGVYSHASLDLTPGDADSDTYGVSVQPAQELWRFIQPGDAASQLWLGVGLGYRHTDTDFSFPFGSAESEADTFFLSPNLVYARKLTDRFTGLIIPAYTMAWTSTEAGPADVDTEAGLFTLTGRGDYGVTDKVTLTGFATWKRDVHMDTDAPGGVTAKHRSWAEFGGSIRVALAENISLRAGYSYDAYHPDYDQHKFLARFELGF